MFVCLRHSYNGVTRVPFTVTHCDGCLTSPTGDCLMCWYRQECFLKVFCGSERKKKKKKLRVEKHTLRMHRTIWPLESLVDSVIHILNLSTGYNAHQGWVSTWLKWASCADKLLLTSLTVVRAQMSPYPHTSVCFLVRIDAECLSNDWLIVCES